MRANRPRLMLKLLRRLAILLLCCIPRCYAQTTTTITGTIKDLTGAVVTSGTVTFDLQPAIQTIIGANASFTPSTVICNIQSNGTLQNVTNSGACVVTMNSALTPPGTSYKVTFNPYGATSSAMIGFYAFLVSQDISTFISTPATSPCYNCGSYLQLLSLPNIWTAPQKFTDVCQTGPLPYIDVTCPPYNAVGDGVTDNTTAIANAITAACGYVVNGYTIKPEIIFPPGMYIVSQPQNPSTSPVFELPCGNLTFEGKGTAYPVQFTRAPAATIYSNAGASGNGAALFDCRLPNCAIGVTFRDLAISGYNKAFWAYGTNSIKLENVNLITQNSGLPDNSALMLTNVFWFEWHGGECVGQELTSHYCILMTGDVSLGGEAPLAGLLEFDNLQGIGGMIRYDQRINTSGSGPGNMVFENIRGWEANHGPFLSFTNSTGNSDAAALPQVNNITINNVSAADSAGQYPLINFPLASGLTGVNITLSLAGIGGSPAIVLGAGSSAVLTYCNIWGGGSSFAASAVVDGSGNPQPGCVISTQYGYDFISNNTGSYQNSLRSDVSQFGPPIRSTLGGNRFAGVALDPTFGLMLNDGADFGFGGAVAQSARGTVAVEFPASYPPTGLAGTPTTGGSLANGTYYGTVYSSTNSSSCNSSQSAPSAQSAAVTLSGSNNAITWNWTLPLAGVTPVLGYCVAVSTSPNLAGGNWQPFQANWQFITGGATTTLSMTTLPSSGGPNSLISTLVPSATFTPAGLTVPSMNMPPVTVGALPSASSNPYLTKSVSDSTVISAEGQTCVGGSTNKAFAWSNGTIWKCF